jgi:4-hydroxybenzoate polyprenyltransferase
LSGAIAEPRPRGISRRARILGHLRLARLPLVGTTVADIWAGHFAGAPGGGGAKILLLHGAAAALYCGGMTLNDAFDAEVDRAKHPERPIPAGLVGRGAAFAQGAVAIAIGLALAAAASPRHAAAAAALTAAILAYDGFLKRWAVPGAIAMGACRYLDVQLGAGFAAGAAPPAALALGAYVAAVTFISTFEDRPGADRARRARLTLGLLLGIFFVDAASLALAGRAALAAAAAALALTAPALARLQTRLTRASAGG